MYNVQFIQLIYIKKFAIFWAKKAEMEKIIFQINSIKMLAYDSSVYNK